MTPEQRTRYLELELEKVNADANQLRKRLGENGRHARRVERAYKDALLLAGWANAHIPPTLRYAAYHQMSRRRWQNAVGLLRFAGVIRHAPGYMWIYRTQVEIEWRIDAVRYLAISNPDAYRANLSGHANHAWEQRYA